MIEKITKKEYYNLVVYPEINMLARTFQTQHGKSIHIDLNAHVKLYRDRKLYVGFIMKEHVKTGERFTIDDIKDILKNFENEVYIMQENGKVTKESEYITFYEVEDAEESDSSTR